MLKHLVLAPVLALGLAPSLRAQCLPVPLGDLRPQGLASMDRYGASVAINGSWCAVGAPGDVDLGAEAGAVYVFRWDGAAWSPPTKLHASDGAAGDHFGVSVSLSGDRLVVGAPDHQDQGQDAGAVYVFEDIPTFGWQQAMKLLSPPSFPGPRFGFSVDVEGDVLVVGSPSWFSPFSGLTEGTIHIYRLVGGIWQLEFQPPLSSGYTRYGHSVATDGEHVVFRDAWSVYIYSYAFDGQTWAPMAQALNAGGDWSNKSVDIDGTRLFAGSVYPDEVAVFGLVAGTWIKESTFTSPLASQGANCATPFAASLGYSLDYAGGRLILGSPCHVDPAGTTTGAVLVYQETPGGWAQVSQSFGQNDAYGSAVGIAPQGFTLAAELSDAAAPAAGNAQAFAFAPSATYCTAKPTTLPGCLTLMSSTGTPSAEDPSLFTLRAGPTPGAQVGILFWGKSGPASTPFHGGTLCVQSPVLRSSARKPGGNPGQCNGLYELSLAEIAAKDPGFAPGVQFNAQAWFRDPGNVFNSSLSDGLVFIVCD